MPCFEINFWVAIEKDSELKALYDEGMKSGDFSGDKSYKFYKEKYLNQSSE